MEGLIIENKDEKIKKALLEIVHDTPNNLIWSDYGIRKKDAIDWLEKQGEQKSDTDFSDLRTWKYIVDAVWTEKEGIGQYLDSPFTEEVAKKLQKRFGNIEQKPTDNVEPKFKVGDWVMNKSGDTFSNGLISARVQRIEGHKIWLEHGTWVDELELKKLTD
jgi:hypothetical protein